MKIYNTLSSKIEEFVSQEKNIVKMYVCGITPYDDTHLGHGRCYVVFDILRRYLQYKGFKVEYVQNFTDIDDKIINKSKELSIHPKELSQKYIESYFDVEKKLNIKPAKLYPKVTEHIDDIIFAIEKMLKKEIAYITSTGVYFDVSKFPKYGKLSKKKVDELISGIRVEVDETKKSPLDFALWKFVKKDEPVFWKSPWGEGRPGWHIECSVMSMKYLGETLDIHGGGMDLIFPHHENEIAQSEAITDKEFVKYWVHNGFVTVNKEKMSKSLKNIFALKDLFTMYDPMVVRLFLLSQYYRKPLDFSLQEIDQFKSVFERFVNVKENAELWMKNLKDGPSSEITKNVVDNAVKKFEESMEEDLNTSSALSTLHLIINHLYMLEKNLTQGVTKGDIEYSLNKFLELSEDVLGLKFSRYDIPQEIKELANKRELARKNRDFTTADKIRQQIISLGWVIEDTPFGTKIRKKV
jgi:cysteinyl-tRNA synthetase